MSAISTTTPSGADFFLPPRVLRADRVYWARTLRSSWPLLRRAIGKAVKWRAVIAAVRRLF